MSNTSTRTIGPRGEPDLAIAAIIPLYNGAEFIEEALTSVISQTLEPAEIIVVDDGSTDEGPDIVRRLATTHRITLIRKENGGQGSARNLGVRHTSCPLIAFLDQDDAWYPDHLHELAAPFRAQRYPELGWVYSNLDEVDREGLMVYRGCLDRKPEVEHPKRSLPGCLRTDMFILPGASLIRRTAFERAGGFDERLIGHEDDDLFLGMFRLGYDNVYLKQSTTRWRIYSSSSSFSPAMTRSRGIYFRKLIDRYSSVRPFSDDYVRTLLAPRFFPEFLRGYKFAAMSGEEAYVELALTDLAFMSRYLPGLVRWSLRCVLPMLSRRSTRRMGESGLTFTRRVASLYGVRSALRQLLGRLARA